MVDVVLHGLPLEKLDWYVRYPISEHAAIPAWVSVPYPIFLRSGARCGVPAGRQILRLGYGKKVYGFTQFDQF